MSEFYDEMAGVALELIEEFGQPVTLRDTIPGSYDPVTGSQSPGEVVEQVASCIVQDYSLHQPGMSYADGTLIKQGDKKILIAALTSQVSFAVLPDGDLLNVQGISQPLLYTVRSNTPSPLTPPQLTTEITIGGTIWTAVNIKEINPAGTPLLYEIQGRR